MGRLRALVRQPATCLLVLCLLLVRMADAAGHVPHARHLPIASQHPNQHQHHHHHHHQRRAQRLSSNDSSSRLPAPSKDAWYRPPDGWQDAKPGDVLRLRTHAYPTIHIRYCSDTFQVLYRTTDSRDQASWSVATVFIPQSHHRHCPAAAAAAANRTACSHSLVTYEVPSDSADPDAAPSFLLQDREPYGEIRDMLARGWFVLVPDYEGPQASFCAGVQAGHATLDAARAVLQVVGRFGFRTDGGQARLGLWGYSGGAFAAEFAVELAASYAPDLRIDAAVIGGPAPNLATVDDRMNRRDTAGLVVASLLGITAQHPAARQHLRSRLRADGPYNATAFLRALHMSGSDALDAFAGQDVFAYFQQGRDDLWGGTETNQSGNQSVIRQLFDADARMGRHGVPTMPTFYYKAAQDEMSPVQETDDLVRRFCDQGANILYHRNTLGGHNDELWSGRQRALAYLAAKLDGGADASEAANLTIPATGCATAEVAIPLQPLYLLPDWWWTEGPGAMLGPAR